MTMTPRALNTNFNNALYNYFSDPLVEGKISFVYKDGAGIPTLGVGYALITLKKDLTDPRGYSYVLRDYQTDLSNAGINLTTPQLKDLDTKLTAAMDALNGKAGATNPFHTGTSTNILDWTITDTQMQQLVFNKIPDYQTQVQTWLGGAKWAGDTATI